MAQKFDQFRLHECVAQGGITEIWLATDEFENVVAIRRVRRTGLSSSSAPKLFKAGLTVHRKLAPHPNIIRYINHGKAEKTPYMVLEYIQGADLKALMTRHHDLVDNVADVLIQMADGLSHLHDHGWIHLDYKPENIMVSLNGQVSLIDFDTARKLPGKPKKFPKISGTPSYMPPEQLLGKPIDHRADIYAWGVTAYELLTQVKPFTGHNPDASRRNQLDENFFVKPIQHHNPEVPALLSQIIQKSFSYHPENRYPNMAILNAQLHKALGVQHFQVAPTPMGLESEVIPAA